MEIHAQRVGVAGPHGPLLKPTGLRVPAGEPVLVAGPPGAGHTAFGLVLSGRMRPSTGSVSPDAARLRRHVVLVDSPGVNEPEASLTLAGVVGEELAMNGRPSGRKAVADWLVERGADEHLGTRYEYVPADLRCGLMLELAAGRPGARVLVLDTPDRYHGDPTTWWKLAREQVTAERSVVVLCTTTSAAALDVPAARLGADNAADNAAENADDNAVAENTEDVEENS
ncbi:ABC transporter ATP-binding protein [Actinosynnema sp. CA-248983]